MWVPEKNFTKNDEKQNIRRFTLFKIKKKTKKQYSNKSIAASSSPQTPMQKYTNELSWHACEKQIYQIGFVTYSYYIGFHCVKHKLSIVQLSSFIERKIISQQFEHN